MLKGNNYFQVIMKTAVRYTTVALAVIAVLAFFASMLLRQYDTWNMPRSAEPQSGRVMPITLNYNITVYVNHREKEIIDALEMAEYITFASVIISATMLTRMDPNAFGRRIRR
jgi:hypothetical protein